MEHNFVHHIPNMEPYYPSGVAQVCWKKNPGHQSLTTRSLCIFCGAVAGQPAQQKWSPFPKVPCLAPLMDAFQQPTNNNSNKTSNSPHQSPPPCLLLCSCFFFLAHTEVNTSFFPCNPYRAAGTTATLVFSPFPKGCTSKLLHFSKCTLQILLGLFLSFFKAIPPKAFALYPKHFSKCLVHFSKCFFTCWSLTSCLEHEKLPCLKAA